MNRARRFRLLPFVSGLMLASCAHPGSAPEEPAPVSPRLIRVDVEDSDEGHLVQQELKLEPVRTIGRSFYFERTAVAESRLRAAGFEPVLAEPEEGMAEVVVVRRKGSERALTDAGAHVMLRERTYWIVRVTPAQRRTLARLGYRVAPLGKREPHPRQVSVAAADADQVREVVARHMDVFHVEQRGKAITVRGAAFDDGIDALRARGFEVKVLPDLPGVTR